MKKQQGFSLIELAIVMVVFAVIAYVSFTAIDPYQGVKLTAAAEKIKVDLQFARTLALTTVKWVGAEFTAEAEGVTNGGYTVFEIDEGERLTIIDPTTLERPFIIFINDIYEGVSISDINIPGGGSILEFDPLGRPYNGVTGSALSSEASITLTYGSENLIIEVADETGRAYVQ